ncbi:hypothetical protein I6F26_29270 [Ensifer sp. IC3342]|nr:hypothetical protein [Ensifer sp. BRP08]MCA1450629.1 hypothetical protein [Ensifer sp. IC3342]
MSNVRKYRLPRLDMPSIFVFPPIECGAAETQPYSEITPTCEGGRISDRRNECSRMDNTNSGDGRQPPSSLVFTCHLQKFVVVSLDAVSL